MKARYFPRTIVQILGKLTEECGEVQAALGKSLRWGLDSTNPELPPEEQETNREWVLRELDDLDEAIRIARYALLRKTAPGDVDGNPLDAAEAEKTHQVIADICNPNEAPAERWREAAIKLWQLLDDIDTSTDAFKAPKPGPFSESLHRRLRRRHEVLTSDGYSLFWPDGELVEYHPGAEHPQDKASAKAPDNGCEPNSGGAS